LLKVRPKLREGFKILLKEEPMVRDTTFYYRRAKRFTFYSKSRRAVRARGYSER